MYGLGPWCCGISQGCAGAVAGKHAIRVGRADAGFFDRQLLEFLEQRGLAYIVMARLT